LEELSDGLEGRSNNPVSVLFDTLMCPNADIGEDHAPSLTWTHDPSKAIPHVVIGNGKPGGSWHHMQPDLETVSLGHWLELPGYPFNQWKMEQERNRNHTASDVEHTAVEEGGSFRRKRALLGEVAQYYEDYVAEMGLEENFLNGVEVVCAMDIRRSKVNSKPSSVSILDSRCSSGSRLSSLSSSPSLYSPSHVTNDVPSTCTELLRSLREDVGYQRLPEGEYEEQLLLAVAHGGSDNIFRIGSETSVGEVVDRIHPHDINVHVSQQSDEDAKTPGDMSPVRGTEVCGDSQERSDSVPFQIQPFTADSEPQQIECFPETNCCCLSDPDDSGIFCLEAKKLKPEYRWCIKGRQKSSQADVDGGHDEGKCVKILAKKIVLACGVGQHRKLGVPGEDLPFVHHQYSDLVPAVGESSLCDPILVVGAGLSAADAVLLALKRGVQVIHAFYQDASDPKLIYHKMSPSVYQEYRHVFALMQGKTTNQNYTPLPKHRVVEFKQGGTCRLKNIDSERETDQKISSCHVLIGNEAELKFLPQRLTSSLGVKADAPIHPKLNPVDIHPYSFQSESVPSLYAVGPLVGDNFVRFVLGGALGIAHHIVNNSRSKDV
jgi:thioredoxin reductase